MKTKPMQVNELRLGNIVSVNNEKYCARLMNELVKVVTITNVSDSVVILHSTVGNETEFHPQLIKYIEPVPLTVDIIKRFGFKGVFHVLNGEHSHLPNYFNLNGFRVNVEYMCGSDKVCYFELHTHPMTELKYIHQLQNLYFAITGEELEFK